MKNFLFALNVFFLIIANNSEARADLENVLADINIQASIDMPGFENNLSSHYNKSLKQIQKSLKMLSSPADLVFCLELSRLSNRDLDSVMNVYRKNRGKGWGVTAQELGIKPGSKEFHALKQGDFAFTAKSGKKSGKSQGKKGKKKGNGNGNGKGKGNKKN